MRRLARFLLGTLSRLEVIGQENVPKSGPLIVVANHFNHADVAAAIVAIDRPMEFLGGNQLVFAPPLLKWLPSAWGYYRVRRGAVSRDAMHAATAVLAQNGFLMIFPEGGAWADVLRPARPGTAFIADRTDARLLPIGLDGIPNIFSALRNRQRAKITIRIGKPFGPLKAEGRGRARREMLNAMGDTIMQHIAELLPPERRGVYSDDPALRAEAEKVADYPFHDLNPMG
ncbi:MAG: 1-acyl-sn-glycerol-3-phosphate acyltransferase [Anaerolineales bacterium]|nr:1-acyl-sn-glycerol-3-phosphate acyltransferase [Anaerolineales bacterium]MCA9932017.1 1-acyl-sn-glycerol-3-phosphate acyltransferase [Anaerolineales bacterium]